MIKTKKGLKQFSWVISGRYRYESKGERFGTYEVRRIERAVKVRSFIYLQREREKERERLGQSKGKKKKEHKRKDGKWEEAVIF